MKLVYCRETPGGRSARLKRFRRRVSRSRAVLAYVANMEGERHKRSDALSLLPSSARRRIPLIVPEVLSLEHNYDETVRLVNDLRKLVLERRLPVFIRFKGVKQLELAATLYLTAELYRCRHLTTGGFMGQWRLVNGDYPVDGPIHAQLIELGFYEVLGIPSADPGDYPQADGGPKMVSFRTNTTSDPEAAGKFLSELSRLGAPLSAQNQRDLQGCLVEAMANAIDHAYKFDRELKNAIPKRWWLTGLADPKTREVGIVVFDQGHGIPRTLDRTLFEWLQIVVAGLTENSPDSKLIEAATQLRRTSTGLQGRGKGFSTMMKFVDRCEDGELLVYSACGSHLYSRRNGTLGVHGADRTLSLGGTLIQWRVRPSLSGMDIAP
jgi:hypothetical protein